MRFSKKSNTAVIALFFLAALLFSFFYLDQLFILWIKDFKNGNSDVYRFIDAIYPAVNYASHGLTFIALSLLFMLARTHSEKLYTAGSSLLVGFLATGIAVQIFKHLIGRARPRIADSLIIIGPSLKSGYDSFPSGHTAEAFCFAYMLSYYFPKGRAVFYFLALLFSASRLKGPSHFPADVMAGAVFGYFMGKLTIGHIAPLVMNKVAAIRSRNNS